VAASSRDPYLVLGVKPGASDAELRAAYRRLVQRHHPDHNNGSAESARRFEEVQEAYAQVVKMRARTAARGPSSSAEQADVEARLADLERQVREARAARERAEQAAAEARRRAARAASDDLREHERRATDEELGYVTTDDSFSKLIDDAWDDFRSWLDDKRRKD
jgi:hypothetical protein